MANKRALLMARVDIPLEIEAEFNDWYNNEHLSDRLAIPGFLSGRRFVAIEGEPRYLALYDLTGDAVLNSEPYLKLRDKEASQPSASYKGIRPRFQNLSRGVYEQIYPERREYQMPKAEVLLAVGIDVPPEREEAFNAWYNTEHISDMLGVPGVLTARRFMAVEGEPKYLALYDLEGEEVFQSEAYHRVVRPGTPWTRWVHTWYQRRFRSVYRRIYPRD